MTTNPRVNSILVPPSGAALYEGETATFWFDDHGILYCRAKEVERTLERQKASFELIRSIAGSRKVYMLADTTTGGLQDKAAREYAAREMPGIFRAMAIISASAFGRMIANTMSSLQDQPVPIKQFSAEAQAKDWLMDFIVLDKISGKR
jgi:hypothetical protein